MRIVGVDSDLASRCPPYARTLFEQIEAALVAYRKTTEGAGRVAQVAHKLAANLTANKQAVLGTGPCGRPVNPTL